MEQAGVREEGGMWPWREGEDLPLPRRWAREPEPWEEPYGLEPYPGSTVLEDFGVTEDDPVGSVRVLARYTVIRVVMLSAAGLLRGVKLRTEQRVAAEHLKLLPVHDWERLVLHRLSEVSRQRSTAVVDAALVAAEAAGKRGHVYGEFALLRAAYHIATGDESWESAARAADAVARLARHNEAPYSERLWLRRGRVLRRRLSRAAAAAEDV